MPYFELAQFLIELSYPLYGIFTLLFVKFEPVRMGSLNHGHHVALFNVSRKRFS